MNPDTNTLKAFNNAKMLYAFMQHNPAHEYSELKYDNVKRDEIVPCIDIEDIPRFIDLIRDNDEKDLLQSKIRVTGIPRKNAEYTFYKIQITTSVAVWTSDYKHILVERIKQINPFVNWMIPGALTLPQGHAVWNDDNPGYYSIRTIDSVLRENALREFLEEVTVARNNAQFITSMHNAIMDREKTEVIPVFINMPGSLCNHIDIIYAIRADEENGLINFMDEKLLCSNEIDKHSVHLVTFEDMCNVDGLSYLDAYLQSFLSNMPKYWKDNFTNGGQYIRELDEKLAQK